jgi:hypothetical protein
MPYQYTNRRGDVYYIQAKDRAGKTAYSATRKPTGTLVDRVPDGYEIYESPGNGQVFARKVRPTKIRPAERTLVETYVRKLAKLEHFIVDVEADSIVVYLSDADPDGAVRLIGSVVPILGDGAQALRAMMDRDANYSKMMRFVLADEEKRSFAVERWCFLGSVDDWYFLSLGDSLAKLAAKYVPHLGKDSFYELGIR